MIIQRLPWPILAAVTLSCCQQVDPKAEHLARQNDTTIINPPGRYQGIPDPRGTGLYVLDTRSGSIRYCGTTVTGGRVDSLAKFAVGCTPTTE